MSLSADIIHCYSIIDLQMLDRLCMCHGYVGVLNASKGKSIGQLCLGVSTMTTLKRTEGSNEVVWYRYPQVDDVHIADTMCSGYVPFRTKW